MLTKADKSGIRGSSVIQTMLKRLAKEEERLRHVEKAGNAEAATPPRAMTAKL